MWCLGAAFHNIAHFYLWTSWLSNTAQLSVTNPVVTATNADCKVLFYFSVFLALSLISCRKLDLKKSIKCPSGNKIFEFKSPGVNFTDHDPPEFCPYANHLWALIKTPSLLKAFQSWRMLKAIPQKCMRATYSIAASNKATQFAKVEIKLDKWKLPFGQSAGHFTQRTVLFKGWVGLCIKRQEKQRQYDKIMPDHAVTNVPQSASVHWAVIVVSDGVCCTHRRRFRSGLNGETGGLNNREEDFQCQWFCTFTPQRYLRGSSGICKRTVQGIIWTDLGVK